MTMRTGQRLTMIRYCGLRRKKDGRASPHASQVFTGKGYVVPSNDGW